MSENQEVKIITNSDGDTVAGIVAKGIPFPEYTPPTWDVWFMGMVYDTARKSKDPSTKIGAVIVKEKRPILFGFNGIPQKLKDLPERMVRPIKYKWFEHGERNAIYCGARFGIATEGTTLYTQSTPCMDCGRGVINAGISKVVVHHQTEELFSHHPQWASDCKMTKEMFAEAGIELVILNKPLGKYSYVNEKVYVV